MARKFDTTKAFQLDFETADRIAIESMKQHYNYTVKDLDDFVLHQKGHPDDYERNTELKKAFEIVLDYYGN